MSSTTSGDNDVVVDALVALIGDIFHENFIFSESVQRDVARMLLNSGKLIEYLGQKYELLTKAMDIDKDKRDIFALTKPVVHIPANLTPAQRTAITVSHPGVELRFSESQNMPHGKAHALRTIHRAQALSLVSHSSGTVLDIGGNYLTALLDSERRTYQLHSCTLKRGELEHHRQLQRDVSIEVSALGTPDYCTEGAENCFIRAPHGICIHALTAIDPMLWPRIFRNHGLEYLVAFFHYDVAMETDDVGYMPAPDMHWARKGDIIECHFEDDSSHPYVHNYQWMLKYGSSWTMTEDDWDYVLFYEVEHVKDGVAKSSFTRLEKVTLGYQEYIPQFRYIDVEPSVDLIVPKFDERLGKAITDPMGYTPVPVRVPHALFSHILKFGMANETDRPDLPLTYEQVKSQCHTFNHSKRVNGTTLTVMYRLGTEQINDIAMGMYLLIVKRAATNRYKFTAYTNNMKRLQRKWGDERLAYMLANAVAYTAVAPFAMLAGGVADALDVMIVHMRGAVSDNMFTCMAAEVPPYRIMSPIKVVGGSADGSFTVREHNDVKGPFVPEEVSPHHFYKVFKDTLDPEHRVRVEKYLSTLEPEGDVADNPTVTPVQEVPTETTSVTREKWYADYDAFQDVLNEKKLPPISTRGVPFEERMSTNKVWDYVVERVQEYMMYNYDTGLHVLEHARDQCRDTWGGSNPIPRSIEAINTMNEAGIKYFRCVDGVIEGMDIEDRYAVVIDPSTLQEKFTIQKADKCRVSGVTSEYVFTSQTLRIFNAFAIAKRASKMLTRTDRLDIPAMLKDGVPGCAKTYSIQQEFTIKDVIVTTVKETRDATFADIARDPRFRGLESMLKDRIRTIDSANMHGLPKANTLFFDEGLMAHSGAVVMAVLDARPKKVVMCGDSTQISFIDRGSRIGNLHFQSLFYWTQIIEVNESVRCPADAMWVSSQFYPSDRRPRIKTFSPVMRSIEYVYEPNVKSPVWEDVKNPWIVVSILRGDMGELLQRNPGIFVKGTASKNSSDEQVLESEVKTTTKVKVFSVHEVQGRTKPFVRAVRISPFNPDVVNSPEHANVMFTRHTWKMQYVSSKDASSDKCSDYASKAMMLSDEILRDMMLPTPDWLKERMLKQSKEYGLELNL